MPDAPRLLHRRSQYGYTQDLSKALFAEGEAVSAEDQAWLTARSHRTAHDAQLVQWRERRAEIEKQIDWLESQRLADVHAQLRTARRQLDRIDKAIASA